MNMRNFEYLVQAAELEHFGRAAARCQVSQPTLSLQIRKLEKQLGVEIFHRKRRGVQLTPAGREVTEQAKNILREYERLCSLGRRARHPEESQLWLGVFPTIAPYLLPRVLPRLHKRCPRLQLRLVEEKTPRLYDKLRAGRIDAALLALPVTVAGLASTEILREPFLLAVHRQHPLAGRRRVQLRELCEHRLLLLEEGHCLREQALEVCRANGITEDGEFRATSLETLKQMVAAGAGITLAPKMAADRHPNIRYIPLFNPTPSRRVGLVWQREHTHGDFYTSLAQILRNLQ